MIDEISNDCQQDVTHYKEYIPTDVRKKIEYRKRIVSLYIKTLIVSVLWGASILLVEYDYGRCGMYMVLICMILFNPLLFIISSEN